MHVCTHACMHIASTKKFRPRHPSHPVILSAGYPYHLDTLVTLVSASLISQQRSPCHLDRSNPADVDASNALSPESCPSFVQDLSATTFVPSDTTYGRRP